MGRPKVAILSRQGIVQASIEILDREGEDQFTMAGIASKLGVKPSSLYNHIDSKENLVELIREVVVQPIQVACFTSLRWDKAMFVWARSYRSAFAAHPNTIKLLATRPVATPAVLYMYEAVVIGLLGAGWPIDYCVPLINATENYILGSALDLVAPNVMINTGALRESVPILTKATQNVGRLRADDAFEVGLSALIGGFGSRLAQFNAV